MIEMWCQGCGTKRIENLTAAWQPCSKCHGSSFANEPPKPLKIVAK